jgi:hypothetical protein
MRNRFTLPMIARDEERCLAAALASVAGLADEMALADTGSADRNREIARACGARVVDFPWCDDFAAARNEALRHPTGDRVFWLDLEKKPIPVARSFSWPARRLPRAVLRGRLANPAGLFAIMTAAEGQAMPLHDWMDERGWDSSANRCRCCRCLGRATAPS